MLNGLQLELTKILSIDHNNTYFIKIIHGTNINFEDIENIHNDIHIFGKNEIIRN